MTENQDRPLPSEEVRYVAVSQNVLHGYSDNGDEINLKELWKALWQGKFIIIAATAIFSVAAVFFSLSLPNIYKSAALLAPANSQQQSSLGAIAGQFGGLASLAGVNLGGGKDDRTSMAIAILNSQEFFSNFAEKYNIIPDLMAAENWNEKNNTVLYAKDVYLPDSDEWIREVPPPLKAKPSMQESKEKFNDLLTVFQSEETGLVYIEIEHVSPYVAKQWVDWLVLEINVVMKSRDKEEAQRSISFLQSQIEETKISEHKTLLFELIEEQTKTLMFAEIRNEYAFKTIDPALVEELKTKPKRAVICIIAFLLGGMLSIAFVLIRHYYGNPKSVR